VLVQHHLTAATARRDHPASTVTDRDHGCQPTRVRTGRHAEHNEFGARATVEVMVVHEEPSAREHPETRGGAKHPESNPPKLFVALSPL